MLRTALPLSRRSVLRPATQSISAQWLTKASNASSFGRGYADISTSDKNTKPSIHSSKPAVLPGSASTATSDAVPPPPGAVPPAIAPNPAAQESIPTIPPSNVPLTPPPPSGGKVQTSPPTGVPPPNLSNPPPPPPPPPLPARKKPRRFRRFILYLVGLGIVSYAGGVWYSLNSDNFHDFFTEYIPFGEEAVLYFEEREFRRRFPRATNPTSRPTIHRDTSKQVTIPSKSGLSWKVAGEEHKGSDLMSTGRHMSALEEPKPKTTVDTAQQAPATATASEKNKAVEKAKAEAPSKPAANSKPAEASKAVPPPPPPPAKKDEEAKLVAKVEEAVSKAGAAVADALSPTPSTEKSSTKQSSKRASDIDKNPKRMPEVNEPSVFIPIESIDPLKINNADEPVVQDLVKTLNDIITVVNSDNSSGRFTSTMTKAKSELAAVGQKILAMKDAERRAAAERVKATQSQFDKAAKELVSRLEAEIQKQEAHWKDEFESERQKISHSYEERLKSEVDRAQQISEQKVRNQLLEQAVSMKKQFLTDIKDRVETERNGRLAKLSELSSSVIELEKLTSEWNSVIDANVKTQHLQVAVEAVKSTLEQADRPRPFIKELAALKEVAAGDPAINSAIASINPIAYQRGVPTTAQLIDRFRRVAGEVRKASLLPEDAGLASHATSLLLSRVLFKKQGLAIGDDVESILTRTETFLEEGNLDEAAREMNSLKGWAKTLSADWLGEVRRVLEVRQALDVISIEARLQSLKVD
ncbi:MAG: Formation of crista junctions protein 1 [Icmadophila ericetorum]|nr:Formation of crista junctions protein 1 [Icmadophila ericetorum]